MSTPTVFDRLDQVEVFEEPFPHYVIHDVLPADYYAELAAAWPPVEYIAGPGELANNVAYLKQAAEVFEDPATPPVWETFFRRHTEQALFQRLLEVFGDRLTAMHPGLEQNFGKPLRDFSVALRQPGKWDQPANRSADLMLDCLFAINSPVRQVASARGPHVDSPAKLFSALLYLRDEDDDSTGGEFELFRLKDGIYPEAKMKHIPERYIECVKRIPYKANMLLGWLNSAHSIHAVSPRSITEVPRRYVAISGECYGGANADGFFLHDPAWEKPLAKLRTMIGV